jgi:hypothetical protein
MIVYLSVIIASMVVFVSGILFNEIWFIVLGGVVSIIVFLYLYLKLRKVKV